MHRLARHHTFVRAGDFLRPSDGPTFDSGEVLEGIRLSGQPGWTSNGGPSRGHPTRSRPYTLDVPVPTAEGKLSAVHFVGVFAMWAERAHEPAGTIGACILGMKGDQAVFRHDLLNGRHYFEASDFSVIDGSSGDGVVRRTIGKLEGSREARVDHLSLPIGSDLSLTSIRFRDLGTAASFVVFDVLFEFEVAAACPFHSKGGGVPLEELGAIVRLGDRLRFHKALRQLEQGICSAQDLDEARGEALTFLAIVTAATLEMGGSRQMHRMQLEAARALDGVKDLEEIFRITKGYIDEVMRPVMADSPSPSAHLVDRALAIVDRNFAKSLTDAEVAEQLGLSTSHFRFLFREATGQPFHKYLIATRLERARRMLAEQGMQVSTVAKAVGFTNPSHFSRAFTQRFRQSPTKVRQILR